MLRDPKANRRPVAASLRLIPGIKFRFGRNKNVAEVYCDYFHARLAAQSEAASRTRSGARSARFSLRRFPLGSVEQRGARSRMNDLRLVILVPRLFGMRPRARSVQPP